MMIICAEGVPVIENPGSSILASHKRFYHLVQLLLAKGISTLVLIRHLILFLFSQKILNDDDSKSIAFPVFPQI